MSFYKTCLRPLLFALNPETAHGLSIEACGLAAHLPGFRRLSRHCFEYHADSLETVVAGLRFSNPLGLAAGWDKNGRALSMLDALGFGFAEIGSISARPSLGNPKPRLFRLVREAAIIVNYGLPNDGAERVAQRLSSRRMRIPLGVNIVKTNDGSAAKACGADSIFDDYLQSISRLHARADYLALNLSCPNAAGGKEFFSQRGNIAELLGRIAELQVKCPVFLKVAPHFDSESIDRWLAEADSFAFVHGFMFNLPSGKPSSLQFVSSAAERADMPGAVSGPPVRRLVDQCIGALYQRMPRGRYAIIGAGGITCPADAYTKIRLGASLVQLYTALVYEGPSVTGRINRGLAELLRRDGFRNIQEAVGTGL